VLNIFRYIGASSLSRSLNQNNEIAGSERPSCRSLTSTMRRGNRIAIGFSAYERMGNRP
jgi:hypothetical protein